MQLNGLNVVVTGGASGMGRAFSLKFAAQGANVAACDMNQEGLDSLVAESEGLPGTIRGYKANVANEEEVIAFFDALGQTLAHSTHWSTTLVFFGTAYWSRKIEKPAR